MCMKGILVPGKIDILYILWIINVPDISLICTIQDQESALKHPENLHILYHLST